MFFVASCTWTVHLLKLVTSLKVPQSVKSVLHMKKWRVAETHRQITEVYGKNVMSDSNVKKWCGVVCWWPCKYSWQRLSLVTDKLAHVDDEIHVNRRFMISKLSDNFPEISRTILYETVTEKLHYHKICARWVPKMLIEAYKNQRMVVARRFLVQYCAERDEYLKRIVTGDKTWFSYVNTETK